MTNNFCVTFVMCAFAENLCIILPKQSESTFLDMDRKPKHDWSFLVPYILVGISVLGFLYLVWDRLH